LEQLTRLKGPLTWVFPYVNLILVPGITTDVGKLQ